MPVLLTFAICSKHHEQHSKVVQTKTGIGSKCIAIHKHCQVLVQNGKLTRDLPHARFGSSSPVRYFTEICHMAAQYQQQKYPNITRTRLVDGFIVRNVNAVQLNRAPISDKLAILTRGGRF
uniref:Uncharacterized protein n=1 Tax=Spironucleus salmonicida TaxID=348837 RepID=V6LYF8_9EUKA|eukprot:EST45844.1 Hypothetical protein SS50377_14186 [Spironucleus salmonicida]